MAEREGGGRRYETEGRGRSEHERSTAGRERWRARDERPVREWERERSSGFERGGEAFSRSPRTHEPERYGYGSELHLRDEARRARWSSGNRRFGLGRSGYDSPDERREFSDVGRREYDDRHNWQDSPAEFGERSYGGYGDWPGPEYEGVRIGREGYGGSGYADEDWPPRDRSGAAEWGLGRSGLHSGWRGELRSNSGTEPGRYTGRGPKGYQRSDERIRDEVCDLLMLDPHIDPSNVTVRVENGEVTLEGMVEDRRMKRAIEDRAEEVAGVKQVHNQLRVEP